MGNADLTALLSDFDAGDRAAVDAVLPLLYGELEAMARRHLRAERDGHTLDTAALVHEAYFKLVDQTRANWRSRSHFLGVASIAMRRILVNYARDRRAAKRGGGEAAVTLHDGEVGRVARADDLLALDEALDRLAALDARSARVVEMWFFGGLAQAEIAEALGVSEKTVRRDWQSAKAWLSHALRAAPPDEPSPR
ncbi:ECF-type sigma factor [Rubrivirga sp. IMCC45206]|uniref:ECF-type sigma factor n=1 Tax=Rubrivirga sp. IMCC45206 TaxID=3391614 RepID=UPI003990099F